MHKINAGRLKYEDTEIMKEMVEEELVEAGITRAEIRALLHPDDFDDHEDYLAYIEREFSDQVELDWSEDEW